MLCTGSGSGTGIHVKLPFLTPCRILEAPEIVPFSFGADVVNHREFAQLTCVVRKGDEPLSITWSLKGDDISSDPSMSTNVLGSRVSMLTITSVEYRHSGVYTCRAENPAGITTYSTELRVNGTVIFETKGRHWNCFCICLLFTSLH